MTRFCAIMLSLTALTSPAQAQGVKPVVKYGKWVLVAGAATMNYLALRAHNQAEDSFNALEARCFESQQRCALRPDGSYLDPTAEELYQGSLHYDRIARGWLIGGESALAGAAALFVWELTRPKGRPSNIPFEPEIRSIRGGGTGVGLRFAF
jgi:hypothetical protein